MINILNNSKELLAVIKDSYNPWRFEEINGENKLSFSAVLTEKVANYVNENNIVELDGDYFDIAYYTKDMNEDGTCTMDIECEHISYRLNDPLYYLDYFAMSGTPTEILTQILIGTGFTIGTLDFTESITYSAQEKKSRRQILTEFIALLGGEAQFDKLAISILNSRGSTDLKIFTKGKNIKVISKVYDGRETTPIVAYTCTPIMLPDMDIELGDSILLVQPELGIEDTLRVVRKGFNPYNNMAAEIEIANYINGLEDQIYRIETSTVVKDKVYHGCRLGPKNGLEIERSDKLAKSVFNSDTLAMYKGNGAGSYTPSIYFDAVAQKYKFIGDIDATGTITAGAFVGGNMTGATITGSLFQSDLFSGYDGVGGAYSQRLKIDDDEITWTRDYTGSTPDRVYSILTPRGGGYDGSFVFHSPGRMDLVCDTLYYNDQEVATTGTVYAVFG